MMSMYPFFGPPFYRRPSPYYSNNGSIYGTRRTTEHNLNYNSTCSTRPNPNYNLKHNSHCNNLHNLNNFSNNNSEIHCSPKVSNSRQQEKFSNSDFSSNTSTRNNKNCLSYIDSSFDDDYSDECFEIFGLKLHFDDLLIICILFFLYQEDVKDTYLYISLILLLLS